MSDDPQTTDTNATPTAGVAAQPAATSSLTPDQVRAMIDEAVSTATSTAYNRGAADARRSVQGKDKSQTAQPSASKSNDPSSDALSILAIRDAFDDHTADLTLTGGQKKLLREHVMSKRPDDVAGEVSRFVELAGWTKPPAAPVAPPPAVSPAPAAPQLIPARTAPPVTDRPPVPPSSVITDDTPILSMSPSDRAAYEKKIGTDKFAEKWLAEARNVRVARPGQ